MLYITFTFNGVNELTLYINLLLSTIMLVNKKSPTSTLFIFTFLIAFIIPSGVLSITLSL